MNIEHVFERHIWSFTFEQKKIITLIKKKTFVNIKYVMKRTRHVWSLTLEQKIIITLIKKKKMTI